MNFQTRENTEPGVMLRKGIEGILIEVATSEHSIPDPVTSARTEGQFDISKNASSVS